MEIENVRSENYIYNYEQFSGEKEPQGRVFAFNSFYLFCRLSKSFVKASSSLPSNCNINHTHNIPNTFNHFFFYGLLSIIIS